MNRTGISLYLNTGSEKNSEVIRKASSAGCSVAFTSFNAFEGTAEDGLRAVREIAEGCAAHQLILYADINASTLKRMNLDDYRQLKDYSVTGLRLDDGFDLNDLISLAEEFKICLNASTCTREKLEEMKQAGVNFSSITACHNFYPKRYTGLPLAYVKNINSLCSSYGMSTMSFIPGDGIKRGPLFEGLPTMENERSMPLREALWESGQCAQSDIILIGDVDCSPEGYNALKDYRKNVITLHVRLIDRSICKDVQHDRIDSSEYVIRSVESRLQNHSGEIKKADTRKRQAGSICVSNSDYGRYCGELEIARTDLPADERVNVVGQVVEEDIPMLKYIVNGTGFRMIDESDGRII